MKQRKNLAPDVAAILLTDPLSIAFPRGMCVSDGYWPLTTSYDPDQYGMLAAVCADLEKGGTSWRIVNVNGGPEVWRDGCRQESRYY